MLVVGIFIAAGFAAATVVAVKRTLKSKKNKGDADKKH